MAKTEIFSESCLKNQCPTTERLSDRTCGRLGELGVSQCPGMSTMGLLRGREIGTCRLNERIADAIKLDKPPVPPSMVATVALGIQGGILDPYKVPTILQADNAEVVERWGAAVRYVETTQFPNDLSPNLEQTQIIPPTEGQ